MIADLPALNPHFQVLEAELQAYRRTGAAIHLAHAARALADLREQLTALSRQSHLPVQQGHAS